MRLIDADELLIAMESWDKFGVRPDNTLVKIGAYDRCFMPYVHYDDMVKCVKGMPTIDDAEIRRTTIDECIEKLYEMTPYTYEQKLDMIYVDALKQLR